MKKVEPQLYLTKAGKEIFYKMVDLLGKYGALEEIDSFGLSMAAHWLWLFHENANAVKENAGAQVTKNGYSQVTAEITIMKTASAVFKDLSAKFGLSNKDREVMMKFKTTPDEPDRLDKLRDES